MRWTERRIVKALAFLSRQVGRVVSAVLLAAVFIVCVVPLGLAVRVFGRVPPSLARRRPDAGTFYVERNHEFGRADFERAW